MNPWPIARLDGRRGFKLVPGRFPPKRHFQHIAEARDLGVLDAIEAMTDDQARDEIGLTGLVPANERLVGSHAAPAMSALSCFNPGGSLFSDGSYGVLYLQLEAAAAISEARRQASAFLAATRETPIRLQMGMYSFGLAGAVADLRKAEGMAWEPDAGEPRIGSRELGKRLRAAGMAGALYANVHGDETDSLAVFSTRALTDCIHCAVIEYNWDGASIGRMQTLSGAQDFAGRLR